jgi:transposase
MIMPQRIRQVTKRLPAILEDGENELPGAFRQLVVRLGAHLKALAWQVGGLEGQIEGWHRENAASRRLAKIPGIGPLTASALVATVGNAKGRQNTCQLAARLGLVPRQHSSGGKALLLGISKRGDRYLRTLLIHGTRCEQAWRR